MKSVHASDVDKLLHQISGHYHGHFKDTSSLVSNNAYVRDSANEGIPEYTRIFLLEIPSFILKDYNIDVSLYVLPADSTGFYIRGLGLSIDIACSSGGSNLLVAAVNKHMRRTHGELSQFGYDLFKEIVHYNYIFVRHPNKR